jgi:hypothetical protein
LADVLFEDDPVDQVKDRITSVTLIMWYVYQWQLGDFDDLPGKFRTEIELTPSQLNILGTIRKKDHEATILRRVTQALDNPDAQGDTDGCAEDQQETTAEE